MSLSEKQHGAAIRHVLAQATSPAGQRIEVGQMSDGTFAVLCDGQVAERFDADDAERLAVLFDALANGPPDDKSRIKDHKDHRDANLPSVVSVTSVVNNRGR